MDSLLKYATEEYISGQTNTQAEFCLRQHMKTRENLRDRMLALRGSEMNITLLLQPRAGKQPTHLGSHRYDDSYAGSPVLVTLSLIT